MEDYFIKLPNNLVWAYEKDEIILAKDYDKLLLTMAYLDTHVNNIGDCCFTLGDLITTSGFLVTKGKGRSIEQFKNTLLYLQTLGWLDSTLDINDLKPKQFICCKYKVRFSKDEDNNDIYFFRLFHRNYKKIIDSDTNLEKPITLKIYCYILARMKRNSSEQQDCIDKQYMDGTVVEEFHDNYKVICKDLDISENTLTANLDLLYDLDLIYSNNIGLVKNKYGSHMANNVYCETEEYLKRALDCSKEYYVSKGYTIVGKKCSKETNIVKGTKGKVKQMKNQRKDTKELENKLEKLQEAKEIHDNVRIIKVKKKGIGNIFKNMTKSEEEPNNISCNEDNYYEISNKIASGQDYWGETNTFETDTYSASDFKSVNPITGEENEYEKYRDKPYEDYIDSLL